MTISLFVSIIISIYICICLTFVVCLDIDSVDVVSADYDDLVATATGVPMGDHFDDDGLPISDDGVATDAIEPKPTVDLSKLSVLELIKSHIISLSDAFRVWDSLKTEHGIEWEVGELCLHCTEEIDQLQVGYS